MIVGPKPETLTLKRFNEDMSIPRYQASMSDNAAEAGGIKIVRALLQQPRWAGLCRSGTNRNDY